MMFRDYLNILEFLANRSYSASTTPVCPKRVVSCDVNSPSSYYFILLPVSGLSVLDRYLIYTFSGLYGKK
jgi:hypothetical protein